jgi:type IV pilus assembly protein PilM
MTKQEVVRRAVGEVLETIGNGSGRLGILLPDASVRVAILRFETLPNHRDEAEALVRWKMGSILPFPAEEARVSYQLLSKGAASVELLAMALRTSVLAEYEAAFEAVAGGLSLVLPATAALLPLLPTGRQGGQILVHICSGSVTTVVVAGEAIRFWRNRLIERPAAEGDGEVLSEIERVMATCRDHLKTEIDDLWIYVRPPTARSPHEEIGGATGRHVQRLTSLASHAATLPPAEKQILEGFGMTFAGLLKNTN